MNLFLVIALHVLSFAALVLATAVALYAVVLVGRKLLQLNAEHASFVRLMAARRERMEASETSLANKAHEGFDAELDAIYYKPPAAEPQNSPTIESVTGAKLWEERL